MMNENRSARSMGLRLSLLGLIALTLMSAPDTSSAIPRTLSRQESACILHLLENISPGGTAKGAIVASPSPADPNYRFHWVRDGALVSDVFVRIWWRSKDAQEREDLLTHIKDILAFSRKLQLTPNKSPNWLGEPKFHVDGSAIDEDWGRPQSDGPARQVITYTNFLHLLDQLGQQQVLRNELYDGKHPSASVIKAASEYVLSDWSKPSFDVWEEIQGGHFYNYKVQRASLLAGAWLADRHGETETASKYREVANQIGTVLKTRFWDPERRVLVPTIDHSRDGDRNADAVKKGIDSVVILAVHHSEMDFLEDDLFGPTDEMVLSTVHEQEKAFAAMYEINQRGLTAIAIGRYPGDSYDGYHTNGKGNPWILTTAAFGESYFRAALKWQSQKEIEITPISQGYFSSLMGREMAVGKIDASSPLFNQILSACYHKGEAYLERTVLHGKPGGHFSEQIKRDHGDMTGAPDLTWSYAAYLTAYWLYKDLGEQLGERVLYSAPSVTNQLSQDTARLILQ